MRLLCGDCLQVMNELPENSIDCVICDLPYGTTLCSWDVILPFEDLWKHYKRVCKQTAAILLFGQEPFSSFLRLSNLKYYRYDIYWEKERLTNITQVKNRVGKTVETISVFYEKQCTYNPQMSVHTGTKVTNKIKNGKLGKLTDSQEKPVFEYEDNGLRYPTQVWKVKRDTLTSNLHPTQKPLELMELLVKTFTNDGDLVLDNCMGSGTTGLACRNCNRDFIGIELDPDYYKIADERINWERNGMFDGNLV